jgi:nitrogen fixation/metabolism regulation signal transduction histidine kinase
MLAEELVQPTGDDEPMIVQPIRMEVAGAVNVTAVIKGDLTDLHETVARTAEQMLEQTMRSMFAQLEAVTERVGNVVQAEGDLIESFIRLLQTMEIAFDENGDPQWQMVASPQMADEYRRQFDAMTPDQARRIDEVLRVRREQYYATRRRRRLPRHG